MSLPRYPEYKDSGVDWLGNVPAHWDVAPLKRGFDVRLGKMLQPARSGGDDLLAPYLRAANIQWEGVDLTDVKKMWFSPRESVELTLEEGDLLVSEGGDVGRSALWRRELERCFIQNSVNRVRSRGRNSTAYLYYWIATIKAKGYVDVLCNKSTIAHFTAEKVEAVPTPFPLVDEQPQIASFLDRETAKIDALIAEQEKLLVLLAKKRQATISHAVTRGLDSNAPMKDSGIAWLGAIPAHWQIANIKRLCELITDGAHISPETEDGAFCFVSTKDVRRDGIDFEGCLLTSAASYEYLVRTGCQPLVGDVLFSKDGTVGRTTVVRDKKEFVVASSLIIIRPMGGRLDPNFLDYLCQSRLVKNQVEGFVKGAGLPRLSIQNLLKVVGVFPPLSEQRRISGFLAGCLERSDRLENEVLHAVSTLKERRSALIAAAVTGQIDVRGLAEAQAA
ncbi:restriction endonuclease subunit S [Lysobacter sp. F6437]|uniref:restriction endonuclease subunit S n=1 Tax=Lysobacter sp. F6437 TaxID=3459296 RepID=UPI00403DE595